MDNAGDQAKLPRRSVVVGLTAVTLAAAAGAHHRLGETSPEGPALGTISAGAQLGRWHVVAVHPVQLGAIPVVLKTSQGQHFQLDIMARDHKGPQGVGNTDTLSVFVANRGDGRQQTDEEQGLGAMALANALGTHEADGGQLPTLLTLAERNTNYPKGSFGVALQ